MGLNNDLLKPINGVFLGILIILISLQPFESIAQSEDLSFEQRKALFEYDKSLGFSVNEIGVEKRGSVIIRDITFVGAPGSDPIEAYLVEPDGPGPFAGILWGHWLGHHTSNRQQYLEEAINLASMGVVSLLINTMWSEPSWYENRVLEEDYKNSIGQVIEMRRAMDLLMSQQMIDTTRVGFVGHDYSGMYGTIAAGVAPLAKTYVFIAVTSSLSDWAFFVNQPKSKVAYVRQNAVFELTDYASQLTGSVLCQFSNDDPFISKTDGNVFFNSLTAPVKSKKRYDAGHFMKGDSIVLDRNAWLIKELDLKKLP